MKLRNIYLTGGFLLIFLFPARLSADNFDGLCTPAISKVDLDINNVRARLLTAGDLWWDLNRNTYEVPAGGGAHSIFAGALWFGALDGGNQLMTAAMTYRQTGVDFWPGPLDTVNVTTNDSVCWEYDRFWKVNRADVEAFTQHYNDPSYSIPESILTWPAHGNPQRGHAHNLAPFRDVDGDGIYNPYNGDYPAFALNGTSNCSTDLLGDQAIWWVFNDKGGQHTETGGAQFGMEVQAMAFAFRTNDALNDATFYRYKIINRSTNSWNQMWMGQWVDSDLGAYDDDYIGCDVGRGMGYVYNGDVIDGTSAQATIGTYGAHPPAIGADFLQGPLAEPGDWIDNDRDSLTDETNERIRMSTFLYYEGDFTPRGNPETAPHFYYFLQARWKDGSPQTYGGNGYGGSVPASFIFPGDSDPYGWGTGGVPQAPWWETNTPFDRRFLMSVGPFTMLPGEVEIVTIAIPWARDTSAAGTNLTSLEKLKQADDYIQQAFDNCFNLPCSTNAAPAFTFTVNGPRVEFVATAGAGAYSWDFGDNTGSTDKHPVHNYSTEGTMNVCFSVTNSCGTQTVCEELAIVLPQEECGPPLQRLEGKGSGHMVIDFMPASIEEILTDTSHRSRFPWYKPLRAPVKVTYEDYYALVDGDYRIAFDSVTNTARWKIWIAGGTDTVYSDSTLAAGNKQLIPQWGLGIEVKQVPNPGFNLNPDRNGFLEGTMTFANTQQNWLTGIAEADYPSSYNWIRAGDRNSTTTGPCDVVYNDRFYSGNAIDADEHYENIIGRTWSPYRLGSDHATVSSTCYTAGVVYPHAPTMLQTRFENIANVDVVITADKSKWTRCIVLETGPNPSVTEGGQGSFFPRAHASVDKNGLTVVQGGLSDPDNPAAADYIGANGMGWFPGYAINMETGERLNMAFGENSALVAENGRDMLWNPSENEHTLLGQPLFGGMHYIYIFGHNGDAIYPSNYSVADMIGQLRDVPKYDAGRAMFRIFSSTAAVNERTEIFRDAMWVNIPILRAGHTLLESDVTVRLRVAKPFGKYNTSASPVNNDFPLYGFSIDKGNLGCNLYEGVVVAYPNPFSESCTILFDNHDNASYSLRLYDVRGRLVRLYENVVTDRIVIEGAGLYSGVYIYSLEKPGSAPDVGKIILR